jgi:hypothetical protein
MLLWLAKRDDLKIDFECPAGFPWIKEKVVGKTRFEICKECEKATHEGFGCVLWKKCCFGAWRNKLTSVCPDTPPRWGKIEREI